MTTESPVAASPEDAGLEAVACPPAWRAAGIALQGCSRGSLLVLMAWLLGFLPDLGDPPTNTLRQMRLVAAFFVAPEAMAWCLRNAFAAKVRAGDGKLRIVRRDVTIEVPLAAVESLQAWTLPLPGPGVSVRLASGKTLGTGLQVRDPGALADAMLRAGAPRSVVEGISGTVSTFAQARAKVGRSRLDHPFLKFVVYSLVPAVPVYRLHQFITYGGAFGEYYTFGLKAYLLGFALWWVSFAMGLLMFAAGVRAVVEAAALLAAALAPARAVAARRFLEGLQRAVFYVGMPAWLAIRLLA